MDDKPKFVVNDFMLGFCCGAVTWGALVAVICWTLPS
jgi:hypothetical protein